MNIIFWATCGGVVAFLVLLLLGEDWTAALLLAGSLEFTHLLAFSIGSIWGVAGDEEDNSVEEQS